MTGSELAANEPREIVALESVRHLLVEATEFADIKVIRDKAEAARKYAKAARMGLDVQNKAATLKLEAERKAGSALAEMKKNQGRLLRGSSLEPRDEVPTLDEVGISKAQSHRWQLEASVPETRFREFVDTANESEREITSADLIRFAKRLRDEARQTDEPETSEPPLAFLDEISPSKFACIYANPPWECSGEVIPVGTKNYSGMKLREICSLRVRDLAADDCHLHIWTTSDSLRESFKVIDAWGFKYASSFVWTKPKLGDGDYWRIAHEFLLFAVRGDLQFRRQDKISWLRTSGGEHDQKPDEILELIELVSPGPRLEVFANETRPGWAAFEVPSEEP